MTRITLPIEPVAWQRVKTAWHGRSYVPTKTKRFKRQVAELCRKHVPTPMDGAISLTVRFILKPPVSMSQRKRPYPVKRPDLDNFQKGILDAGNGVLWKDDSQVVRVEAWKLYDWASRTPRIEIELEAMEGGA